MMISGLVWGAVLGYWVHGFLRFPRSKRRLEFVTKLGLIVMILIFGLAMVRSQVELVKLYQSHASQWDTNHEKILAMRDSGETPIAVDPMPAASATT